MSLVDPMCHSRPDPDERRVAYATPQVWIRLLAVGTLVKLWTSSDGELWRRAHYYAHRPKGVEAVRTLGIYGIGSGKKRKIRLETKEEGRKVDAFVIIGRGLARLPLWPLGARMHTNGKKMCAI